MVKLHNKKTTKYVMIILVIMMLCNFVMPSFTYAKTDTASGGEVYDPLVKFLVFLCDSIFQFLQNSFTSLDSIRNEEGEYNFQYSPGIIFSGRVPAFDINFVSPDSSTNLSSSTISDVKTIMHEYINKKSKDWYKSSNESDQEFFEEAEEEKKEKDNYILDTGNKLVIINFIPKFFKYDVLYLISGETIEIRCKFSDRPFLVFWQDETYTYYSTTITINEDEDLVKLLETRTYQSTASQLQRTISTWYKALRRIALVGLLSVLVYIGIRIVLTSSSPDKQSKYKRMLTDWFVAICLLFTLHYLMAIIVTVVQQISKFFNLSGTDYLLNSVRNKIASGLSWQAVTGSVIMYIVLCIYTIIFTIQYIKRVIYIGFFTMIAPLVTLTYPLDKISDGKAQAFNMWLREYIFNSLLQVIHLLIYTILVSSALSLVEMYPIYAIVVIGFMTQGEKIIRKMFGFETATSVGTLQSFVAGGLVANALKSIQKASKPKSTGSGGEKNNEGSKPVRTVDKDPLAGLKAGTVGANANTLAQRGEGAITTNTGPGGTSTSAAKRREAFNRTEAKQEGEQHNTTGIDSAESKPKTKPKKNVWNGVKAVSKKYVGPAIRTVAGGAGALVGGTIGFAAGVAQGDMGKALGGVAGGLAAGNAVGQKAVNGAGKVIDTAVHIDKPFRDIAKTYHEGAYGEENSKKE